MRSRKQRSWFGVTAALVTATAMLGVAPVQAAAAPALQVRTVGQIARQDIAGQPGSEPRTLVEPDIAVSPLDPDVAIAVSHDGRFPDGGAVDLMHAWTSDGGVHWQHAPMPGLTTAVGGSYERASDGVVAFGPDGMAYVSSLLFDVSDCRSAVAVSRSRDGGRTFGPPNLVHRSETCTVSDDKNWLVVDTWPTSPNRGRLYQFWTPFLFHDSGRFIGAPQVLRYSDDQGRHWSRTAYVSSRFRDTQNSQPMIQPDGTIVDTYMLFPPGERGEGPERGLPRGAARQAAGAGPQVQIVARTSHDGGATWGGESTVVPSFPDGPPDIRCCLHSATQDVRTGRLYVAWDGVRGNGHAAVQLSSSPDGRHWSAPVVVNRNRADAAMQYVNVDVAASGGRVFVSYAARDTSLAAGRYLQQELSSSFDRGRTFGPPLALGPRSDLKYAAFARGIFPGDYIGSAVAGHTLYTVWAWSTRPPDGSAFNQSLFAATVGF